MKSKRIVFLSALMLALFMGAFTANANVSEIEDCNCNQTLLEDTIPAASADQDLPMKKFGKTPEDSVQCRRNISLYREYYNQWENSKYKNNQLLKDALPGWRKVFHICPMSSKNVYIRGARMYKKLISLEEAKISAESKNSPVDSAKIEAYEVRKEEYVDTLLLILDRRMKYFTKSQKSIDYIKSQQATVLFNYRKDSPELYYPILKEVFDQNQEKTHPSILSKYFAATYYYMKNGHAGQEILFYNYLEVKTAIEKAIADTTYKHYETLVNLNKELDSKMANVATEDRIKNVLGKSYEEDSTNLEICNLIVFMSEVRELTHLSIYYRAATQAYSLDPSPNAAFSMGKLNLEKERYAEAETYLVAASEGISDSLPERKADAYLLLAETYLKQSKYSSTSNAASKVLEYRPNDVFAYMYMGDAYASSKCEIQGMNAIYWVAYDKYAKALSLVPEDNTVMQEGLRKRMGAVKSRFPEASAIFQRNLKEGQTIRVECWVGESTTVRAR